MEGIKIRCSTSVAFTIAILIVFHIQDNEARMTMEQIQSAFKPAAKACLKKTGLAKETLDKTHEGEFPPDRALQCFEACIVRRMKVVDSDNKLNLNMALKQIDILLPEALVIPTKEIAESCFQKITSTDLCESSWEWARCFYETNPALYFFP